MAKLSRSPLAATPEVTEAAGRLGDEELNIDIGMGRATTAADTLSGVRGRISTDVERNRLLSLGVNVALTGYDQRPEGKSLAPQ